MSGTQYMVAIGSWCPSIYISIKASTDFQFYWMRFKILVQEHRGAPRTAPYPSHSITPTQTLFLFLQQDVHVPIPSRSFWSSSPRPAASVLPLATHLQILPRINYFLICVSTVLWTSLYYGTFRIELQLICFCIWTPLWVHELLRVGIRSHASFCPNHSA